MIELLPGIMILTGVYVVARILNHRETKQQQTACVKREADRRNKIDALYGRDK